MRNLPTALAIGLFDAVPDVVCFAKDASARYVHANRTLLTRLGLSRLDQLVGRTSAEVFPAPLGAHYLEQDIAVIAGGGDIHGELERHLFPNHIPGWCVTEKRAVVEGGRIVGLVGVSRDLKTPRADDPTHERLAGAIAYARERLDQPLAVGELAEVVGVSGAQLARYFERVFELTPTAWLLAERLTLACHLLDSANLNLNAATRQIAEVAYSCGFRDHSAFSRAFRRHVGLSPSAYARLRAKSQPVVAEPSGQ